MPLSSATSVAASPGGNARQQPSRYPNLALGALVPMATLTAHGPDVAFCPR